ncbi:5-hydroxytryptamine receptor 1A [Echinococcus granulosus]|uniref:5-hydroxytryptamine receptor n=1 Tax=Echinococcus granulosus TaxID=6210 RepID=U6JEN4_ECHGR|nr:5-hydroxytryptamine receptor [Echinococcus granulosus]EUB59014.1 5-hydroxytryptamine receptor [Echinococcus granulosus]KAH9286061.1 5-hydroxytryptamine receptor 1A [Echinococcus granulosus]CDS22555.1 biogenic amine 5HT receptor [Echinococcus granulosus]
MASQLNDPSITFKAWGWSENCTLLLDLLINRSIPEEAFLAACKPHAEIDVKSIILAIVLGLLLLGTAGGNMLVIIAILIVKKLRSPTNLLIVNLAVTDFLVSILVLPFAIAYQILGYWPFNQIICDLYSLSDVLLCTLSILSLCTISIDRYLAITKPLQYAAKRTPKRMLIMIIISWLLSAAISIPPVFGWEQKNSPFYCGYSEELTYQIYATMTAFYIPLTVMLVLYGKILVLAKQMASVDAQVGRKGSVDTQTRSSSIPEWNRSSLYAAGESYKASALYPDLKEEHKGNRGDSKPRQSVVIFKPTPVVMRMNRRPYRGRKINSSPSALGNNGRSLEVSGSSRSLYAYAKSPLSMLRHHRRRKPSDQGKGETHKAVTTLGVIMGCFTICWLPFFVSQLITPIINCFTEQRFSIPPTLFQVFIWLGYGNSFLNPLLYALFNREFRLPFLYILRLQCNDINTRLRTETFSHQFGLPQKSRVGYSNSLSRGSSSVSGSKRQRRQKPRGLSPLTNSQVQASPSNTSQVAEASNVEIEKPPLRSSLNLNTVAPEEPKLLLVQHLNNLPSPLHLTPLQPNTPLEKGDLLKNNHPPPSWMMSRRESLASIRSNYDTYIPNLNAEFQRSPLPTPSSAPAYLTPSMNNVKMWTKAREFRPNQVPSERFHRWCENISCTGVKSNSSLSVANP